MDMKKVYKKFCDGDSISNDELDRLLQDTRHAIDALDYRPEFGIATHKLLQDWSLLDSFKQARERNK